jgi:hypothetical protein
MEAHPRDMDFAQLTCIFFIIRRCNLALGTMHAAFCAVRNFSLAPRSGTGSDRMDGAGATGSNGLRRRRRRHARAIDLPAWRNAMKPAIIAHEPAIGPPPRRIARAIRAAR